MRMAIAAPFQKHEKLPATRPDRMVSEAPPSREALTISATWRECDEVNTLVSSGITAAASVPHEMITDSFHHSPGATASRWPRIRYDTTKVTAIDSSEVIHTRLVSGASKSIFALFAFWSRAITWFTW